MDKKNQGSRKCFWILLILVGFFQNLQATQPYIPQIVNPLTESWRWKHLPELEGKGIRFIAETADQKVWVSCNEGVLEYDGYDWKTHDARNGLTASPVEQLLITDNETIYATSAKGIFSYDGKEWQHFFVVPDNMSFVFYRIKQLSDLSIMACSNWGIIHFQRNGEIQFYSSPAKMERLKKGFPDLHLVTFPEAALAENGDFSYASDLLEVDDGTFWFALTIQNEIGVLLKFNKEDILGDQLKAFEVVSSSAELQLGERQQLLYAHDKRIWVINSTSNKGIGVYDGKNWEYIQLHKRFGADEYMTDIVQSANGTIWISSMARIFAYANADWQMYRAPAYPIPANRIMLQNSQKDQLWVAGYKSKVLLLDFSTEQWATYSNLSFQFEVSPEEQWFLEVNNRIVQRKESQWISYGREDGLIDAPISIKYTSQGQIWVAGSHHGVAATAVFKNGSWERHLHPKLSWGIDYRSFFEAKDGSLWFGASVDAERKDGFLSGVLELPNPTADKLNWIHHVSGENGLNQGNVYGIGQSKDGRIWIGGSRLLSYDGKTWQASTDERLQQYVNVIYGTGDLLLVGSRYYGVFIFDGEKWTNYNTSSGLSGNTIISIDALSDSCIFVATENDICRFDGESWTQNIFPEKLNMDFEGGTILHTDPNTLWINHVPRSWKRRAYQNSEDQAEEWDFFTTRYQLNRTPPRTMVDFFLESVSPEGNSLISWKGKDFFAQTSSEQLTYSYRINKGPWSVFTKENQHTFTSLPSGMHTLEVRARDLDFNIDPTPAQIEFEVLPPIWKQGWFLMLIFTFLTIFGIYEYRVLSKKRKLEILNRSLQVANDQLTEKGRKIQVQNQEILAQQEQILTQAKTLEINNKDLEERNAEIRQQRDKLEEMVEQVENLSKSKLAFFTNISHELRTPLTLILGPAMQLQSEGESLSNSDRNRLSGIIERNASRLLKLINQLLEMRRIEHNALLVNHSEIHLPSYISEMVALFRDLAIKREIHLDFTDNSQFNLVALDSDKVEKIIVNLLSNAFKYTPIGGSIQVELDTVFSAEKKLNTFYDQYFEIAVEDTGSGIGQEKLDLIFEKYYTSESDITDAADSGIGLSYIRDLIYLMQGEIRVQSQVDKGSRFMVYLPVVPVKESAAHALAAATKPCFKVARQETSLLLNTYAEQSLNEEWDKQLEDLTLPTILLVEDNPDMLHFLENILHNQYRVLLAENGKEGLKIARNQSLDLIISDVMMPEMDGLTFCEKIKDNFATSHIPVILLTAKMLEENRMSGFLKGADDYITKPFNPEFLQIRIENLLQQRRQLREVFTRDFMLTPKSEKITSPDEELLHKLVQIMNENLTEADFNVDKMCKMVHLSHMHFIRKVKQLTGKKPGDLLKSFRMKKAKELLAQQKLTIAEVAYKVGFDLPNSFSRAFKKEFNVTPTEFVGRIHIRETSEN